MDRHKDPDYRSTGEPKRTDGDELDEDELSAKSTRKEETVANPPRTTSGGITAPKFGSAGSCGAELEPGLPKN